MKWISVKESLPEEGKYIVWTSADVWQIAFLHLGVWCFSKDVLNQFTDYYVTHWMEIDGPDKE